MSTQGPRRLKSASTLAAARTRLQRRSRPAHLSQRATVEAMEPRFLISATPTVSVTTPTGNVIKTLGSGFSYAYGVAVDAARDIFVADYGNGAVKEILANSTILTVGSGFSYPTGVEVDAAGDVFVADAGNNALK